jgi:hypothetical protein
MRICGRKCDPRAHLRILPPSFVVNFVVNFLRTIGKLAFDEVCDKVYDKVYASTLPDNWVHRQIRGNVGQDALFPIADRQLGRARLPADDLDLRLGGR